MSLSITLDQMLAKPGFYMVVGVLGDFLAEIDDKLICHQLNHKSERDGILDKEGWNRDMIVHIFKLEIPEKAPT